MDLGIEGRVALVTSASKGLGLAVATALAQERATVAISSRSREQIDDAAARIGARGLVHDAAGAEGAADFVRRVEEDLGPIAILVTNSGGPPASVDALSFSLDQWRAAYEHTAARADLADRGGGARDARAQGGADPVAVVERGARAESSQDVAVDADDIRPYIEVALPSSERD